MLDPWKVTLYKKNLLCKDIDKRLINVLVFVEIHTCTLTKSCSRWLWVIHSFKAEQLLYEGDIFYE